MFGVGYRYATGWRVAATSSAWSAGSPARVDSGGPGRDGGAGAPTRAGVSRDRGAGVRFARSAASGSRSRRRTRRLSRCSRGGRTRLADRVGQRRGAAARPRPSTPEGDRDPPRPRRQPRPADSPACWSSPSCWRPPEAWRAVSVAVWATGLLRGVLRVSSGGALNLDLSLDPRVALSGLGVALFTGVATGIAPALQATRPDMAGAMKEETAGAGARRSTCVRG